MSLLEIKDLHATVDGNKILNGINLTVNRGEIHAIMGPNGSGKSTLAKVISGHPDYHVESGEVLYEINGKPSKILELEPSERAREGIFLGFQYPVEIPGVTNSTFLKEAFNSICKHQGAEELDAFDFNELIGQKCKGLNMDPSFIHRPVNEGFSGGEKKKNEILQMSILNPILSLLDETDSGLDIDALKIVAKGVNDLKSKYNATILVTHYQRLLDYIVPDFVHVLYQGKIIKTGGKELALELEKRGYDWVIGEKVQ
ncbi:MAG: Fe-S cluster assembly ATPase SufC [Bacteriovoracaceae bacterium]|jgi:Fe-S cluster assembly ATP-binding protein|nr:Fe-S cluster assembly ATPase SufC [Bacteriovoracaceae bacterium]